MNAVAFSALLFLTVCLATGVGATMRRRLPAQHLDSDSRDVVKLVMALISTMSAITLGLLVSSAQGSYTAQKANIQKIAADVIDMDRTLRLYGPESKPAREFLRQSLTAMHDGIWTGDRILPENLKPARHGVPAETFGLLLRDMKPTTELQQLVRTRAMQLSMEVGQIRLMMFEQVGQSISWYFIVALAFWISVLFFGYGMLTQVHTTVVGAWVLGALSISVAMFLILELNEPYDGIIQLSDAPIRGALMEIGD
jgi:hypothetical protein